MERKYSLEFEQVRLVCFCALLPFDSLLDIQIIDEDENQAMVVNDQEDFDRVVSVSWLPSEGPWSEAVLRSRASFGIRFVIQPNALIQILFPIITALFVFLSAMLYRRAQLYRSVLAFYG